MRLKNGVRSIFFCLFALAALALVSGCGKSDKKPDAVVPPKMSDEERRNFSDEPPPVQILSGDRTGYRVKRPTIVVNQTLAEEGAMFKRHFTHGVKKEAIAPSDFKSRQVLGLFLPTNPKGTLLVITDIHEESGAMQVNAVRLLSGKGCPTAKFKPRPFHIVETRKLKGEPKLVLKDQRSTPC